MLLIEGSTYHSSKFRKSLILLWAVLYGLYSVLGEWNVAPSKTLLSIPGEETDFGDQDLEFHDANKGIANLLFPTYGIAPWRQASKT